MKANEYQKLAARTICDNAKKLVFYDYLSETIKYGTPAAQLNHSIVGLGGEQGELCTALQRWLYYGKPLDQTNLVEEFGDALWYIAEGLSALGVTMEQCMSLNISKLAKRYPEKYSDELAAEENRDREAERNVLERQMAKGFGETVADMPLPINPSGFELQMPFTDKVMTPRQCSSPKLCPQCKTPRPGNPVVPCPECGLPVGPAH